MNPYDFINFKSVSRVLSNKATSIQKTRIPDKHKPAIDDLMGRVDSWVEKYNKPKKQKQ